MIRLIATKHLVYDPEYETVYSRHSTSSIIFCGKQLTILGQFLGTIHDPQVFIVDLDIIAEWQVLQDFVSAARR